MGRIDSAKGVHLVLKAAELLPNLSPCEIYIFGATRNKRDEGYKKDAIRKYRGRIKIVDHGFICHGKISEVYEIIDVLLVPSILPESFGFVVAESFIRLKYF